MVASFQDSLLRWFRQFFFLLVLCKYSQHAIAMVMSYHAQFEIHRGNDNHGRFFTFTLFFLSIFFEAVLSNSDKSFLQLDKL